MEKKAGWERVRERENIVLSRFLVSWIKFPNKILISNFTIPWVLSFFLSRNLFVIPLLILPPDVSSVHIYSFKHLCAAQNKTYYIFSHILGFITFFTPLRLHAYLRVETENVLIRFIYAKNKTEKLLSVT